MGLSEELPGDERLYKKIPGEGDFLFRQEAGLLISVSADHLVGANVGYIVIASGNTGVVQITFLCTI